MIARLRTSKQSRRLLSALLAAGRDWRHGYDLSRETALKSGTLYPLLIRLKDLGILEARWSEPEREGKPPRHEYRLTADGFAVAREHAPAAGVRRPRRLRGEAPA